jgi:splicing factor 1
MSADQIELIRIKIRLDDIQRKLLAPLLVVEADGARSPSPEPVYNERGVRTNTREQRTREKLTRERDRLIEQAMKINPAFGNTGVIGGAGTLAKLRRKPEARLDIPVKDHPHYNFIGLIIGPRGNTQKR